jgi:hypothetical protein
MNSYDLYSAEFNRDNPFFQLDFHTRIIQLYKQNSLAYKCLDIAFKQGFIPPYHYDTFKVKSS